MQNSSMKSLQQKIVFGAVLFFDQWLILICSFSDYNSIEDINYCILIILITMMGERASILKKKGLGANGQFQNMHLAVFPYQLEYQKDVNHRLAFYFQKKYQVIGKIASQIEGGKKGTKASLKTMQNIINFRLFSQYNVIYQWSAYRIHENGEQEFNDCCTINLKEQVSNFIVPQGSGGTRSVESLINLSFTHTELKLKFAQLGLILSTVLIVADDPKTITEFVQRKYIPKELPIPQINLLKLESSNKSQQNKHLFSGSSMKEYKKMSQQQEKSSINLVKNSSNQKSQQVRDKVISSSANDQYDLDNIILTQNRGIENFDASIDDEFQQITFQIQQTRKNQSKQTPKKLDEVVEEHQHQMVYNKELQVENEYKQGILKLQSDQVIRQKEDSRLEYEELQAIEEEDRSNKQTFSPKFKSPKKSQPNPFIPKTKYSPSQEQQKQQLAFQPKWTLKKVIIGFIILTLGALSIGIGIKQLGVKKRNRIKK